MESITKWIERKLGLKVNATKTKVVRPNKLKYLGFGFYYDSKSKKLSQRNIIKLEYKVIARKLLLK